MDLLSHMEIFVRIVEAGSLSGAARSARLSLPAVSRQLSALEKQLGTALIVRSTRRLSVTDAGRTFYDHAKVALREAEHAMAAARTAPSIAGRIRVSVPFAFGMQHVVPRLEQLVKRHPGLHVDLHMEDEPVDLIAHGVDIAIRAGLAPPDSTDYVAHPMLTIRRMVVATPSYLKQHGVPKEPSELANHVCFTTLGKSSGSPWRFVRDGRETAVDVRGPVRASTPAAIAALVRAGLGVAYLPDWVVAEDIASGRLRQLLAGWAAPGIGTWLVHRAEHRKAARIRAFVELMTSG
ncbi:MAG TPA: LysR family transcriptional regulator [Polyangiaceae bacterium]|nr:LysR family transcriptional regulator [Polyangiaceae bacterium]